MKNVDRNFQLNLPSLECLCDIDVRRALELDTISTPLRPCGISLMELWEVLVIVAIHRVLIT